MTDQSEVDALRAALEELADEAARAVTGPRRFHGNEKSEQERAASATDEERWKEDARRYAQNADYWRDLYETAAATIERLRTALESGNYLQVYDHRQNRWLSPDEAIAALTLQGANR